MDLKQIFKLFLIIKLLTAPTLLYADIITDGSFGEAGTLTGPDYIISEKLGTVKGSNLFHSFEKFSIKHQESATFTGSDGIKNVISRVTGGEKSEIDGTLRSNVGNADFYFINPKGIVFGPNAQVDVPAAFHASTTNELKFQDSSSFRVSNSKQSSLTEAPPEAFGFLDTKEAGSIEINGAAFEFNPETKISLNSNKDITIKGSKTKRAGLVSEGGEIAIKANSSLVLNNGKIESSGGNGGGKITINADSAKIQNSSMIAAENGSEKNSDGGVDIGINRNLELSNSYISTAAYSKGNAGIVKINAGSIKMDMAGIGSTAEPDSEGNAGLVKINASEFLEINNSSKISTNTRSKEGDAGDITINSGNIKIAGGGSILSNTFSKGDAGNITINADNMKLFDIHSYINSAAGLNSSGNGGLIKMVATNLLEIIYGAGIVCNTEGQGDAGNINVQAHNIRIDGKGYTNEDTGMGTGIFSRAKHDSSGFGGNINVEADTIYLHDALITTSVFSKKGRDGGNISINEDSNPADFLVMQNGYIQANTQAEGSKGGKIRVNVDNLVVDSSMDFKVGGKEEQFSLVDRKNIIQAADPSKNPQDIQTPSFTVDLVNSLALSSPITFEPLQMAENYCGTTQASSLTFKPREWFSPFISRYSSVYFDEYRLQKLIDEINP